MLHFREAIREVGIMASQIIADGCWHRCPTEDHPRKRNGSYKLMPDGRIGFYRNFALTECLVWRADINTPYIMPRQFIMTEETRKLQAMESMRRFWAGLNHFSSAHPYLERKSLSNVGCDGLRITAGNKLVIPMICGNELRSVQTITPDGEKRFFPGCPISGAYHILECRDASVTCFVEGFATGLAIFQSLPGSRVIVCFNAGNLPKVAKRFINTSEICVVCADNDWEIEKKTGTNPGVSKAFEAASMLGCGVAIPTGIIGTDWADYMNAFGDKGIAEMKTEIMRNAKISKQRPATRLTWQACHPALRAVYQM